MCAGVKTIRVILIEIVWRSAWRRRSNPRAIMTGITRVSRESIFSDPNNLKIVTTTPDEYAECFGFMEEEVFATLDELGMLDKKQEVKRW